MQQKTFPWESMPEMRSILVMEMKEGKIYPMLVLEGGFLHGNLFMKTYEPTRVMWSVPSLFSISTNNFISGMDSKGDSCCSMPCYWLISEIGKLFSACNGDFCSSGWLMNCPSDRQCLHKKKYVWFAISCIQVSELKDFQQLLLIFNIWFLKLLASLLHCH